MFWRKKLPEKGNKKSDDIPHIKTPCNCEQLEFIACKILAKFASQVWLRESNVRLTELILILPSWKAGLHAEKKIYVPLPVLLPFFLWDFQTRNTATRSMQKVVMARNQTMQVKQRESVQSSFEKVKRVQIILQSLLPNQHKPNYIQRQQNSQRNILAFPGWLPAMTQTTRRVGRSDQAPSCPNALHQLPLFSANTWEINARLCPNV